MLHYEISINLRSNTEKYFTTSFSYYIEYLTAVVNRNIILNKLNFFTISPFKLKYIIKVLLKPRLLISIFNEESQALVL